jgi:hypothetical protein
MAQFILTTLTIMVLSTMAHATNSTSHPNSIDHPISPDEAFNAGQDSLSNIVMDDEQKVDWSINRMKRSDWNLIASPLLMPIKIPLIAGVTGKAYGAAIPAVAGAVGAGAGTMLTAPFTLMAIAKGPLQGGKTAAIMSLPYVYGKRALLKGGVMLR